MLRMTMQEVDRLINGLVGGSACEHRVGPLSNQTGSIQFHYSDLRNSAFFSCAL